MKDALGLPIDEDSGTRRARWWASPAIRLLLFVLGLTAAVTAAVVISNNYTDRKIESELVLANDTTLVSDTLQYEELKRLIEIRTEQLNKEIQSVLIKLDSLEISQNQTNQLVNQIEEEYYRHLEVYHSYYK